MFLFRKVKKRGSMKPNDVKEALERFLNSSSPELLEGSADGFYI